jgi:hypothetical protein
VLFTFPSRYLFTIGHTRVLRLGGWSPHVQTEFLVFRLTRIFDGCFYIRGYHPLRPGFPSSSTNVHRSIGLVPFRSPLLRESRLMSFPPGTEMFQFPGFASLYLCIQYRITSLLEIKGLICSACQNDCVSNHGQLRPVCFSKRKASRSA